MTTLATFLAALVVIGLAVAGLALGVLNGRAPIAGSCGGVGGRCAACRRSRCRHRENAAGEE